MNLEQFEILDAVVKHGSFNGAAKFLHKTQPAVSMSIRTLEDELKFTVFDRSGYRPVLTDQGQVFYSSVLETIESFSRTKNLGNELGAKDCETVIKITLDPLVAFTSIVPIFKICQEYNTLNKIIIKDSVSEGGIKDLLTGGATFAFGDLTRPHPELDWFHCSTLEMIPAISQKLKKEFRTSTEIIKKIPQAITYNLMEVGEDLQKLPPSLHPHQQNIFVSKHSYKLNLIKANLAWGRLPINQIGEEGLAILSKKVLPEQHIKLCFMRNKNKPLGEVGKLIWNEMKARSL